MHIDKVGPKQTAETNVQKTQAASEKVPSPETKETTKAQEDKVSISKAAKELQEAKNVIQNTPDVREAKVADIKKQVQEGTYNVPAEAVVDKLLSVFKSG